MSIQRWDFFIDSDGPEPDDKGYFVTYDDHVAEVERVRAALLAGDEGTVEAVEDMRAACIAAVEACMANPPSTLKPRINLPDALAALREVTP